MNLDFNVVVNSTRGSLVEVVNRENCVFKIENGCKKEMKRDEKCFKDFKVVGKDPENFLQLPLVRFLCETETKILVRISRCFLPVLIFEFQLVFLDQML